MSASPPPVLLVTRFEPVFSKPKLRIIFVGNDNNVAPVSTNASVSARRRTCWSVVIPRLTAHRSSRFSIVALQNSRSRNQLGVLQYIVVIRFDGNIVSNAIGPYNRAYER